MNPWLESRRVGYRMNEALIKEICEAIGYTINKVEVMINGQPGFVVHIEKGLYCRICYDSMETEEFLLSKIGMERLNWTPSKVRERLQRLTAVRSVQEERTPRNILEKLVEEVVVPPGPDKRVIAKVNLYSKFIPGAAQ